MQESIKTTVIIGDNAEEMEIIVDTDNDVFELRISGKRICRGDWSNNLRHIFKRALEIW